jgi:hypothetical protein
VNVPAATRRALFERDGERCTFTDAEGHRCSATTPHNLRYAEQTFGAEHVQRKIREGRHPRPRGYATPSCALAASGLAGMGFRKAETRRALDAVAARHPLDVLAATPVQAILREALALLT